MNYNIVDEPWIESPFFYEILKKKKTSTLFKKLAIDMHENGYCVFNLNISNKFIDSINHDISSAINSGEIKKNPKIYHYNENPRVVEAWKYSKKVASLANNSLILK